jgi:phospholipid/cholesterol/gamma-HCH transport system substrate-binding protein
MRAPWRKRSAGSRKPDDATAADPRVWGRDYRGPSPWVIGGLVAIVLAIASYLAFAKELPWSSEGYTVNATFENAATLRATAPVRIAGVNVGEVTSVEPSGASAKVTFSVDEEGRPLHTDAEVVIRPRLFLEGNFFLEVSPGSPSAPELEEGGDIPITQTATAVQLDEVLTALQAPQRRGLQRLLAGFGTALTYQPTAADDADQDPDVRGESAAESLNDAFRYGGAAGRDTAIVSEALLGENPHDLSKLIAESATTFQKLASREQQLASLITNFNVTAGAFASESQNLSDSIALLDPTLDETEVSLGNLSDALPALRALARESVPGIEELPATIEALDPWLPQARRLMQDRELGGLSRLLRGAAPGLAEASAQSKKLFPITDRVARCTTENLVPTADTVITADGFDTGQPNFQEFLYGAVQLGGAAQSFDGNGSFIRLQPAGGPNLVSTANPGGAIQDTRVFGTAIENPAGVQPVLPDAVPPFRMDVRCHTNAPPDLNGPSAAAGPPDLVP